MNYFFSININSLKCKLTIPRFRNKDKEPSNFSLFSASILNNKWKINEVDCYSNNNFYTLNNYQTNNTEIFFLSKPQEIKKNEKTLNEKLLDLNQFTNTVPDFRCNLKIYNDKGGFSSYQADYPHIMATKNGNVVSPLGMLLNNNTNSNNFLYFQNIFYKPIKKKFSSYILDLNTNRIIKENIIQTNKGNVIKIEDEWIKKNYYFFSKNFLGIPIYISILGSHISLEHTHPPQLYILGEKKFKIVKNLKEKCNEIVSK